MGDKMALENQDKVVKILLLALVVILVVGAIALIVDLISSYKKENRRIKEILEKNENRLQFDSMEDNFGLAYAGVGEISTTQRQFEEPDIYGEVRHFTDTGTSIQKYGSANGQVDTSFVIVKSVIYTETREEL